MSIVAAQHPFSAREVARQAWGLDLPTDLDDRLGLLAALLSEANQHLNLTSITDRSEVWEKHFLDSLSVVRLATHLPDPSALADVGAGAGFPGLVVAMACPDLRVTLIEATARKVEFIRQVAEALGLQNATAVVGRAEELGLDASYRERFDAAVARAVASTASLVELLAPLVRVSGQLWLMKTEATAPVEVAQAAPALEALGCELRAIEQVEAPPYLKGRRIVVLEKRQPTPARFPRRIGIAQKRPLTAGTDMVTAKHPK